jgi:hypothetical protein
VKLHAEVEATVTITVKAQDSEEDNAAE